MRSFVRGFSVYSERVRCDLVSYVECLPLLTSAAHTTLRGLLLKCYTNIESPAGVILGWVLEQFQLASESSGHAARRDGQSDLAFVFRSTVLYCNTRTVL